MPAVGAVLKLLPEGAFITPALKAELLDHVIPLRQSRLERLLCEFIEDYYHIARPHQGLGGETPVPHEASDISGPTRLVSMAVLGGLHHPYRRVAA